MKIVPLALALALSGAVRAGAQGAGPGEAAQTIPTAPPSGAAVSIAESSIFPDLDGIVENEWIGFRIGVAGEIPLWRGAFSIGGEFGYNRAGVVGADPPADTADLIPLIIRGGYSFALIPGFIFRPEVFVGAVMVSAGEFFTVPLIGFRLAAEYRLAYHRASPRARPEWALFVSPGIDLFPQTNGLALAVAFEAGVKLRFPKKD